MRTRTFISGTGLYHPPHRISNDELVASFNAYVERFNTERAADIASGQVQALTGSSVEFIEKASGIKSRYVVEKDGILDPARMRPRLHPRPDNAVSLMAEVCVMAATQALDQAKLSGADVDAVICACANYQRPYPAIAIEVQNALGAGGFAYDMNVACSSATFGIAQAVGQIACGNARRVLVVSPEITSGHLEWRDRDCHFIFGDVCTAVIVESEAAFQERADRRGWEILGTQLMTQYSNNIRNNAGYLSTSEDRNPDDRDQRFYQNGRQVFKEVCPLAAEHIQTHLASLSYQSSDVKRYWLHQANINMNVFIARKLFGRDATHEEAPIILDEFANTAAAGSVIAFHRHQADLAVGDVGVLCSFGAGYSIGSVVLKRV